MTEEDTFRRLVKISLEELITIIENLPDHEFETVMESTANKSKLLNLYGWTIEEYDIGYSSLKYNKDTFGF